VVRVDDTDLSQDIEVDDVEVSHDQLLPKALVHKDGYDDVFLTDFAAVGGAESVLGASLPRSHGFYCELPASDQTPDLAALIEVARQACFVVAHEQYDVPLGGEEDAKFLMRELSGEFADTTPFETDEPVDIVVHCEVTEEKRRGDDEVAGLTWEFTMRVGDVVVGHAEMSQTLMSRSAWGVMRERLRTGRGLPPKMDDPEPPEPSDLEPTEVGRQNPDNVVLTDVGRGPGCFHGTLLGDLRHPVMFDHPANYVFAMVQLEAARQLSLLAAADELGVPAADLEMHAVSAEYFAVAEFDLTTELRATVTENIPDQQRIKLDITAYQQDRRVSAFELSVRAAATRA
jgi:2-oxo-3-(phosphooxy)propyl 3-oxoalkanoate synthase